MVEGKARRVLLMLLTVAWGAALAWIRARHRAEAEPPTHSWSEPTKPEPVAPVAPLSEHAAERAATPTLRPVVTELAATTELAAATEPAPAETPAARPGPYPGSVLPLEDGSAPSEEFVVKGNAGSMRCHSTTSPYFGRTRAQVWFRTEEDAAAAGFRPWEPRK